MDPILAAGHVREAAPFFSNVEVLKLTLRIGNNRPVFYSTRLTYSVV